MTMLDRPTRAGYAYRVQRRLEIVTVGGVDAVIRVADTLRKTGFPIGEFAADVRDGVPYGSVTCTVSLTHEESAAFPAMLSLLDEVVAVQPR